MNTSPTSKEIERQYRVARQTLAMHCDLRDQYERLGVTIDIVLLVVVALLSCTIFAGDDFYRFLRLIPTTGRFIFGCVSALAFAGSLVNLVLNPRGRAAMHRDAISRWSPLVLRFRQAKRDDDTWAPSDALELATDYARTNESVAPVPDVKFNRLKSRYLRKAEISRLKDRYPGCPRMFLATLCRLRDTGRAIKAMWNGTDVQSKP